MDTIQALLDERKLPAFTLRTEEDRKALIAMLAEQEYGITPEAPEHVTGEVAQHEEDAFAGKAIQDSVNISFDTPKGVFTFPITLVVPKAAKPAPVFVYISFEAAVPNKYLPMEEIIDRGYAVACVHYEAVTADSGVFDKIAEMYPRDEKTGWGKIGMWAFAASRVLDYLETREDIDAKRASVVGHSRLGKTALWCGAQDERFTMVISNDSGCSGAAISRGKVGESIEVITRVFPYWFCGNYRQYACKEYEAPFDQHMLLSLVAPRVLYVCSAKEDEWADPDSEYLSCHAASPAWKAMGKPGFLAIDGLPQAGDEFMQGNVCYHVRFGTHFLSRRDWNFFMDCRDMKNI